MLLRLVNYVDKTAGSDTFRVGLLTDDGVLDLHRLKDACGEVKSACDCPECWKSALGIVTCPSCLEAAQGYADWFEGQPATIRDDLTVARDTIRLLSPVPHPGKVLCLAQNFPEHAAEANRHITHSGDSVADAMTPHVFLKPSSNTVRGDGDVIPITPTAQFIDYEAEVVVVIGKTGKYIKTEEAAEYIAGVTCMNDVSERKLKIWERKDERPWDNFFDWLNGKWMDGFAPMGPCLVPAKDLDVNNLTVRSYVNGELRQQDNTSAMFHSAAACIEYISQFMTLEAGDVIALGTPAGVGIALGHRLVPGDVVTVEVEGVGTLSNEVVAE
jgi:2-keto-4-pentenoate hydratase/2-oxohepta-3-ene-1,7-dioic acid hydratase in catechol pathway